MLLVLTILAGGALGYWIVRKYVISEDGRIDAGIAQFVRWALNIFGVVFVLQVFIILYFLANDVYTFIYCITLPPAPSPYAHKAPTQMKSFSISFFFLSKCATHSVLFDCAYLLLGMSF